LDIRELKLVKALRTFHHYFHYIIIVFVNLIAETILKLHNKEKGVKKGREKCNSLKIKRKKERQKRKNKRKSRERKREREREREKLKKRET